MRRAKSPEERFWERVEKTSTCWLWTGSTNYGYGTFMIGGINTRAHRFSWELRRGPIPDGLVIDHLCRIHECVNPDHLEPVTIQVNTLRGIGTSGINARKTHCIRGHEFTPENTRMTHKGRNCRQCERDRPKRERGRFVCPVCHEERDRSSLRRHLATQHPDAARAALGGEHA